jgi:hypothetical protein
MVVRRLSDLGHPVHEVDCLREVVEPELALKGAFGLFPSRRWLERHTAVWLAFGRPAPSASRRLEIAKLLRRWRPEAPNLRSTGGAANPAQLSRFPHLATLGVSAPTERGYRRAWAWSWRGRSCRDPRRCGFGLARLAAWWCPPSGADARASRSAAAARHSWDRAT